MSSNPETLIDIEKTIKDATDFIDKKKLAINVLIDNEAKDLTRKGYNKTQLQTAIDTAKTMVTDMGNQMESDLNKMKKSQIGYEEGKGGGKLYHRKRNSSRKKKSRRNIKSTKRKKRHSKRRYSKKK